MADIEGSIFMSNNAYNYLNSTWPKYVIDGYLQDGLSHNDVTHDITVSGDHSFAPHDTCAHDNYDESQYESGLLCAYDEFAKWVDGHPDEAADVNVCLLLNSDYDGKGGRGLGNIAVSKGAEYIDNVSSDLPRSHTGYAYAWAKVAVHEAGHCLGGSHGDGLVYSFEWDGEDSCYITPMNPDYEKKTENNCGEPTEDVDWYSKDYKDQYYWYDCTGAHIRDYVKNG